MRHPNNLCPVRAKAVFKEFFDKHPNDLNPTDINSATKLKFWEARKFEGLFECQWYRKRNTKRNDYPAPWTRKSYWDDRKQSGEKA
jgi:hypothetical protein